MEGASIIGFPPSRYLADNLNLYPSQIRVGQYNDGRIYLGIEKI